MQACSYVSSSMPEIGLRRHLGEHFAAYLPCRLCLPFVFSISTRHPSTIILYRYSQAVRFISNGFPQGSSLIAIFLDDYENVFIRVRYKGKKSGGKRLAPFNRVKQFRSMLTALSNTFLLYRVGIQNILIFTRIPRENSISHLRGFPSMSDLTLRLGPIQ